jgi:hypothetical protein
MYFCPHPYHAIIEDQLDAFGTPAILKEEEG